jgi:restriction system protein
MMTLEEENDESSFAFIFISSLLLLVALICIIFGRNITIGELFGLKNIKNKLNLNPSTSYNTQLSLYEVDNLNGYDFEDYIGKLYRNLGYSVEQTSLSGDQGADLIVSRDGERIAVQTKRYSNKVSNKAVQEVVASKALYKCTSCMVVTNNYFTNSAIELARANNVELIDRDDLKRLIKSDSASDLQIKAPTNSVLTSTDKKIYSSNIIVWDDEIEKQDIELLCPSCNQSFTHNIEIQKLTTGKTIETDCPNCEIPISLSL